MRVKQRLVTFQDKGHGYEVSWGGWDWDMEPGDPGWDVFYLGVDGEDLTFFDVLTFSHRRGCPGRRGLMFCVANMCGTWRRVRSAVPSWWGEGLAGKGSVFLDGRVVRRQGRAGGRSLR